LPADKGTGDIDHDGLEALILGGMEPPLILTQGEFGIPFLNTAAIRAGAMVWRALGFNS
jgi:aspartate/glutamate racemase